MIRVFQAGNNAEADVVCSILTSHGIPATVQGYNHRSLLGFMGPYIQLNILVPEEREEESLQLIADLHLESAKPDQPPAKRNRMVAFLFAFIVPGFGSLYLRRTVLGIVLVSATAAFLVMIFVDDSGLLFNYGAIGLAAVVVCDAISAFLYRVPQEEKY